MAARRKLPQIKHNKRRRTPTEKLVETITTPPPPIPGDDDPLFDVMGVAAYLGMNRWWIYQHVQDLPTLKVGRFLKFRKSHIDRWLEAQAKK